MRGNSRQHNGMCPVCTMDTFNLLVWWCMNHPIWRLHDTHVRLNMVEQPIQNVALALISHIIIYKVLLLLLLLLKSYYELIFSDVC